MGPFVKSDNKTSKIMLNLLISLIPIILFSFYKNGILLYQKGYINFLEMFYPLIFILIGSLSSLLTEEIYLYVFGKKRGKELIDNVLSSYGLFPGLFLSLVLPINTPLSVLFIGSIFAVIIGKMIFGGFGNNIFNPALVGCIFVITCFSAAITNNGGYLNKYEIDTISSATPLTNVSIVEGIGDYDTLVKPYGNLLNFFIGTIPGAVGETSALLCIVAFIYLTITKTIKWRIPVTYISTVFVLTFIIGYFNDLGIWYPLFQILSGGLLFGSIFMASDPVTSPVNKESQIIYGILLGLCTVLLRYLTSYPEGVMTSILLLNMFVFIIDRFTAKARFKPVNYYIVLIVLIIISLLAGYGISTKYKSVDYAEDPNYEILSKNIENNQTIYTVSQKGFGGKIKAKITFDSRKIISIDIIEHNESIDRYQLVENQNYINSLLNSQANLDNVDTVSGATITSNALKKLVLNTINDFAKGTGEIINNEHSFTIVDKIIDKDITTYIVNTDSFGGTLELKIVMRNNIIRTIIPLNYNDTCISESKRSEYYTCPEYLEDNYIKTLIKNQDNLDSVDTISGATISSSALKKTLKELKEGN